MIFLSRNKTNMTLYQITRHFRALASKAFYAHFIIYLMTLNVDNMDPNIENYQETTTQLTYGYVSACQKWYLVIIIYLNENAETFFFVKL